MGSCFSCCLRRQLPNRTKGQLSGQALNPCDSPNQQKPESMGRAASSIQRHPHTTRSSGEPLTVSHRSTIAGQSSSETKMLVPQKFTLERKIPSTSSVGDSSKRVPGSLRDVSDAKINALFDVYRDTDEDCILADGIERLCHDLNLQPEEYRMLLLAWKFKAEVMCQFTRSEFVEGCHQLQVDSIKLLQSRLPDLVEESRNTDLFRDLYRWSYRFGLEAEKLQRVLPVEMAISLWRLVFTLNEPSILQRWLRFLEKHPNIRGITKDTWEIFLNFAEVVDNDLSNYDDSEAWPSLFDDFVEYENDRQNQNLVADPTEKDSDQLT